MLSCGGDTEEPWFALSKDRYQNILDRALSEMAEAPAALPPSTIISNCSELIKLLNQDDELGSGSTGEERHAGTIAREGEGPGGGKSGGGRSTLVGSKRDLTGKSSATVIAEKIPRRFSQTGSCRSKYETNDRGTVKRSWKSPPQPGSCSRRLPVGKLNARTDCARDATKRKSVAWRAITETVPVHPQGISVKQEVVQCTSESRTLDLSLNQRNCMTTSAQSAVDGRYPLRIPRTFNLRIHDAEEKQCCPNAKKCYTARSSVANGSFLKDLLTVETKSIPDIDLKMPNLVPVNSLERKAWRSSHLGRPELVEGAMIQVKVEQTSPEKTQLTQKNVSTIDRRQMDNNPNAFSLTTDEKVRSATEPKKCSDSWFCVNSASTEVYPFTDITDGDWDVGHQEGSMQIRSRFSMEMEDLERDRYNGDQPRTDWKKDSEEAETPSSWPYCRNSGFEVSCLNRNESQISPVKQTTEYQRDAYTMSVHAGKTLHLGKSFAEDSRGHGGDYASCQMGQMGAASKCLPQHWAFVDKTLVRNMMEKILEKETGDTSTGDLEEASTKSSVNVERALGPFKTSPVPHKQAALLSCKTNDEPIDNSTDFPLHWEPTDLNLNGQPTFLNSYEQFRDLVNDDVIGDIDVYGYSESELCQLNHVDDVAAIGAYDVRSESTVHCDVSTLKATLLNDLKLRAGASTNDNGWSLSCVKVEPTMDAGNGADAKLNDVTVDVTRVDMSRMSFKWKSNILRRIRNDQMLAKKWCLTGTLLA